ncbi:MAG: thiamine pyrophosphate-binding protein [Clostridiales bacterium]|nr:thiamine pyrophosphate-binding protein [Clostridiales bacterium]
MRIKLSNYVSQFCVDYGITNVFTVTGGGAMHLNDAFGHQKGLTCLYQHHEQACAIAAESYARMDNKMAVLCVTTGPGGTNALTGVVGAYLDSIPMLVISGQVRYDTTARYTGLNLRAVGDQEFDICKAAASMTKYCEMVIEPNKIRYCLEKAMYIASHGRPGPCWLDIPVNVQGSYIETEELEGYCPEEDYEKELPPAVEDEVADAIIEKIRQAKRPVFYAGNGIRISGGYESFRLVVEKLNIPVVTTWDGIDEIETDHPLYTGRGGGMGDRAGNFAVQNSDLVFAVGNRLSIRQVGFNHHTWAREAYVIVNDIDKEELKKPTIHVDMPIWADAKDLLEKLEKRLPDGKLFQGEEWLNACQNWKKTYPVLQPKHFSQNNGYANVYAAIHAISSNLDEGQVTVVGNGSACVVGSQSYIIKKDQRFIINSAIASMGYDLPAVIGTAMAWKGKNMVCITGDGSIQMNLQELQTIVHHQMPIKIFLINNSGYHSIRQTQRNFFGEPLVGIGADSRDLSFPDMEKLAWAYGIPYMSVHQNNDLDQAVKETLAKKGPMICEIFVDTKQNFEPKSTTKRLEDGTLVSAPLEDLAPFLSKEELKQNMFIPLVDEIK